MKKILGTSSRTNFFWEAWSLETLREALVDVSKDKVVWISLEDAKELDMQIDYRSGVKHDLIVFFVDRIDAFVEVDDWLYIFPNVEVGLELFGELLISGV